MVNDVYDKEDILKQEAYDQASDGLEAIDMLIEADQNSQTLCPRWSHSFVLWDDTNSEVVIELNKANFSTNGNPIHIFDYRIQGAIE